MAERRTTAKLIHFLPERISDTPASPAASRETIELRPLMTAADVGHMLQVSKKRVYEVVGHLAVQIAPHTLRWRYGDILALIDERRRAK
jgi:hypothetical protein